MIENGDRVLIGVSGGKDSLLLMEAMKLYQKFSYTSFEVEACMLDLGLKEQNTKPIEELADRIGIPFTVEKTDIGNVVFEYREERSPCALCANLRRGALNTAALDTRIKATVASTMYDMTRVNAKGYFDSEDSEEQRYQKKAALCAQRLVDYKNGAYALGGGVIDPLPEDAPFFVKDYYDYYKTARGYHKRSLNSNGGWNVVGCQSFINQPILKYSNEIRSAVLVMHGDKAHSCYFGKDAYANMVQDNPFKDNKELLLIPGATHTDLYDGGENNAIPWDKLDAFFRSNLKA